MILNKNNLIKWLNLIFKERTGLDVKFSFCDLPKPSWEILLPDNSTKIKCKIIPNLYKVGYQRDLPCSKIFIDSFDDQYFNDLILPGIYIKTNSIFSIHNSEIYINYDFVGLIYWCLNRSEEYFPDLEFLDEHNRFKACFAHSFIYEYLDRPIVDEWFYFIKFLIKKFF